MAGATWQITKWAVRTRHGVVAAQSRVAAEAGADVLRADSLADPAARSIGADDVRTEVERSGSWGTPGERVDP